MPTALGLAHKVGGFEWELRDISKLAKEIRACGDVAQSAEAFQVVGKAAAVVSTKAESNARSADWPHELFETHHFFTDSKPSASFAKTTRKVSALFGVAKRGKYRPYRPGYVEWANKTRGESLATMFEFGTSKMGSRPAFRPAMQSERENMLTTLQNGLRDILGKRHVTGAGESQLPSRGGEFL